jgi:hypothetical protein
MIPIYLSGESYAITLPGDRDPKTIFHILPIKVKEDARRDALQAFLIAEKQKQSPADTIPNVLATADQIVDNDVNNRAERITLIEDPWPAGDYKRVEGREAVARYLQAMPKKQYDMLGQVMIDGNLLRELSFRRDSQAVVGPRAEPHPQGDDRQGSPEGDRHVRLQDVPPASGQGEAVLLAGSPAADGVGDVRQERPELRADAQGSDDAAYPV